VPSISPKFRTSNYPILRLIILFVKVSFPTKLSLSPQTFFVEEGPAPAGAASQKPSPEAVNPLPATVFFFESL
jgi:hypothetical protein